jgi:Lipocalin-like domain
MAADWLVGAWRLVSAEVRYTDRPAERPWGDGAVGLLIYDRSGYMSVQIMRAARPARQPRPVPPPAALGTIAENEALGYLGYCGRYEVNEAARTITHHVEGGLLPEQVGARLVRGYEHRDGRLVLRTAPITVDGHERSGVLTFERAAS